MLFCQNSAKDIPTEKAKKTGRKGYPKTKEHLRCLESELGSDTLEELSSIFNDTNKILSNMKGENL